MSSHTTREFVLSCTPEELRAYIRSLDLEKYHLAIAPWYDIEKELLTKIVNTEIPVEYLPSLYIASIDEGFALVWPTSLSVEKGRNWVEANISCNDTQFKYICVVPKQYFHNITSAIIRTCVELNSTAPLVRFFRDWTAAGSFVPISSYGATFTPVAGLGLYYQSVAVGAPIIVPKHNIYKNKHFVLDCSGGRRESIHDMLQISDIGSGPYVRARARPIDVFLICRTTEHGESHDNVNIRIHGALWQNVRALLAVVTVGRIRKYWRKVPKDILIIIIEWYMCAMYGLDD